MNLLLAAAARGDGAAMLVGVLVAALALGGLWMVHVMLQWSAKRPPEEVREAQRQERKRERKRIRAMKRENAALREAKRIKDLEEENRRLRAELGEREGEDE